MPSSAVRHKGGNAYEMDGTLKLRGVEKDLTVPFTLDINRFSRNGQRGS